MAMPPLQASPRPTPILPTRAWNSAERHAQADRVIAREVRLHGLPAERRKDVVADSPKRRFGER